MVTPEEILDRRKLVDHVLTNSSHPLDTDLLLGVIAHTLLDILETGNEAYSRFDNVSEPGSTYDRIHFEP